MHCTVHTLHQFETIFPYPTRKYFGNFRAATKEVLLCIKKMMYCLFYEFIILFLVLLFLVATFLFAFIASTHRYGFCIKHNALQWKIKFGSSDLFSYLKVSRCETKIETICKSDGWIFFMDFSLFLLSQSEHWNK